MPKKENINSLKIYLLFDLFVLKTLQVSYRRNHILLLTIPLILDNQEFNHITTVNCYKISLCDYLLNNREEDL